MKDESVKQRKPYIDSLRGIAMLVVVYGHCLLSQSDTGYSLYFVYTSPFNVALFFVISGYLFTTNKDTGVFLKYLLTRLVVPWLVLGLFPYYNALERLPDILSGKNLWFMPALIIGELIWYYLNKYFKNERSVVLSGLFVSALGMLFHEYGLFDYAMINRAMTIQWLFILGRFIKKYECGIVDYIRNHMVIAILLYFALGMVFIFMYPSLFYDVHLNRYYFIPLTWGMIVLGVLILFTFFKSNNFCPKWLVVIGQNTLPIYIFSDLGRHVFNILLSSINYSSQIYPITAIVETAFACMMCIVFCLFANRYVPELVGRKRIKIKDSLKNES